VCFLPGVAMLTRPDFRAVPALRAARKDLEKTVRTTGKGVRHGTSGRLRDAVIVSKLRWPFTLLWSRVTDANFCCASAKVGRFSIDHVLVPGSPASGALQDRRRSDIVYRPLLAACALPGVIDAAESSALPPFFYGGFPSEIEIPGAVHAEKWSALLIVQRGIFPGAGIELKKDATVQPHPR